ncbi:MAG: hypothetical protein RL173_1914, partial [Fibrobacterota bacterium]
MMLQVMKKNKEGAAVSIDIGRSHNGYRCNLDYFQVCKNATQGASMTNHTGNAVDIHIDSTAELSFEFSTLKIPLRNSASSSSKQAHCLALIDWLEEFGFATGDRVRVQGVNPKAFKTGATNTLRTEGFAKTGTWTHIDATTYAYKAYVTNAADLFAPRYTAGQATTPTVPPSAVQEKAPPQNTAPPAQPAPKSQPAKPAASTASTPSPKDLLKNAEDSKKWFETNWTSFFDAYRDAATADANDGIHTDRGFFPVGQNLTWHGGIHAQAQTDGSIHAMTDGVIVAARLSDKDPAKLSYGSRNFVLIKHTTPKSLPFWSLYMHLRPLPLKPETPELGALFPWLVKQTLKQIGTESSNFRGSPAANAPILRTIEPGETFAVLDQKMVGTQKWIKAKADKDKLDGWVAMTSRFELKSEIDKLQDLKAGKVVKLDKPVKRNDCIGFVSPALPGRSAFVHWEVFSDQVVSDQWIQVKDEDNDIVCDAEEFKKLLNKSEAINFMNELTKADIIAAYSDAKTSAEIRKRTFFFTSEWSVDWNTALDKRKDVYDPKELAPRLLPYNFWKDAEAAGCDVPKGGKIWHYHPAEFILREFPVAKAAPANSESAPDASQDEFDIDWDFIAAREGTELKVYVPTKNGTVIGVSGPTIASGFDLGQTTLTAFLEYGFSSGIQESLKKFIGIKGQPAVAFVENNPCTLTAEQIREINHKVKPAYARKTEKYYNQSVLAGGTTFKQLPRHVQTPFVSVCFQYGKADTLKSKLLQ